MEKQRTVSALFAQGYLMFGVMHGVDPEALCSDCGFRPSDVADRERQIPFAWAEGIMRALAARLPQLALGLELGRFASLEQLGYLGQALLNCGTALEALTLLARSARLLDSAYQNTTLVVECGERVEFRTPTIAPPDPKDAIEMGFVQIAKALRSVDAELGPCEVRFAHERDEPLQGQLRQFFQCPVQFAASGHAMIFERALLERPVPNADGKARENFEAHINKLLDKLDQPFTAVVARLIEAHVGREELSQARIAKLLHMSTRSLQRRLQEQGASYQGLLAQARCAVAQRLLSDGALAIYEVAFATGYDDAAAFNRAFRQWTGVAPSVYRERHSARHRARRREQPAIS